MGLFNHENLQVSCYKDKKTCRFIKGFRKLICSISEIKRTFKGRLFRHFLFYEPESSKIPGHVFRKTRATFFSLWRENFFLPEPKRKFSRATFLGTHNGKILEPKEYRGSNLLFREFLLR